MNIGRAPFEVRGSRSGGTATTMQVTQRVYDTSGGSQDLAIPTTMGYGGDGHGHWHVADLTTTELVRLGNGVKVGTGAKGGFCFFDNAALRLLLPGAPQAVTYPGSGGTASSLDVTMGLSVGWGDAYRWNLPDQYVDITGPTATPATRVATTRVATEQSSLPPLAGPRSTSVRCPGRAVAQVPLGCRADGAEWDWFGGQVGHGAVGGMKTNNVDLGDC